MLVAERVDRVLRDQLGRDKDWDESTSLTASHDAGGLDLDNLDMTELVMRLEEEFGVNIPDEAFEEVETVAGLLRRVESLIE